MVIRKGYKQTELGIIPEDWDITNINYVSTKLLSGGTPSTSNPEFWNGNIPWTRGAVLTQHYIEIGENFISKKGLKHSASVIIPKYNIVVASRVSIGNISINKIDIAINQDVTGIIVNKEKILVEYLYWNLFYFLKKFIAFSQGTSIQGFTRKELKEFKITLPLLSEQEKISKSLYDIDQLIDSLEKLIEKKKNLKQGAMHKLLTGKKRLEGFSGEWETKTLDEVTISLDNIRIPLNDKQRKNMQGNIPYCGANGILDYINDYVIDDEIILIAEDGGHFDEYLTRPIAYVMNGKCWINNHAHVLKAKEGFDQNFIFYSLVHKNILKYLAGGTRAKLNKSEMFKIEIHVPNDHLEQVQISQILSDMDSEIQQLETQRDKYINLKQAMMQKLLTGEIRLV